jgi:hypothetical protein
VVIDEHQQKQLEVVGGGTTSSSIVPSGILPSSPGSLIHHQGEQQRSSSSAMKMLGNGKKKERGTYLCNVVFLSLLIDVLCSIFYVLCYARRSVFVTDNIQEERATLGTNPNPNLQSIDTIFVKEVRHDGPAYAAGLRPGDRILTVNDQSINGKTYSQVIAMIQNAFVLSLFS